MDIDEREQNILLLAKGLLSNSELPDEATIDSGYIFRFETVWCRWVDTIRRMMMSLLGITAKEEFYLPEIQARILVHLNSNPGTIVGMRITEAGSEYTIKTAKGAYSTINPDLRERFEKELTQSLNGNSSINYKQLWRELWHEANQTHKIQNEIRCLVNAYQIVPQKGEETFFAPRKVAQQYQAVLNWILEGVRVPSFLYNKTLLLESPTENRIRRSIRPHKWSSELSITSSPRILKRTRVRTWTVYFTSKRGGGKRTEESAIDIWNDEFNDCLEKRNYIDERKRLFMHESEKG